MTWVTAGIEGVAVVGAKCLFCAKAAVSKLCRSCGKNVTPGRKQKHTVCVEQNDTSSDVAAELLCWTVCFVLSAHRPSPLRHLLFKRNVAALGEAVCAWISLA